MTITFARTPDGTGAPFWLDVKRSGRRTRVCYSRFQRVTGISLRSGQEITVYVTKGRVRKQR